MDDDYVQLNVQFLRALHSHNTEAALHFASEIENKFPGNPNIKAFRDVLAEHAQTIQRRKANGEYANEEAESSDSDDDGDEEEEDSEGDSGAESGAGSKVKYAPQPPQQQAGVSPARPSAAASLAKSAGQAPSIRDYVTLHPSRELDDEVDKMFADADAEIAAELNRRAAKRP